MIRLRRLSQTLIASTAVIVLSVSNPQAAGNEVEMPEDATSEEIVEMMKTRGIVRQPPSGSTSTPQQQTNIGSDPQQQTNIGSEPETYLTVRIYFEYDSDRLTPKARDALDRLGGALSSSELEGNRWVIEGHTDASGRSEYNQMLSERRAISVYEYLVSEHAMERTQLVPLGKGETELYDANNPNSGENRRVRIGQIGS